MITIDELELATILKRHMSEKDFFLIMDILHDNYSMSKESIPIDWIKKYASGHDAVCIVNLENMIRNWEMAK